MSSCHPFIDTNTNCFIIPSGSCFKFTYRTPNAAICRFLYPKLLQLLQSYIDGETCEFVAFRAFGLEYYNICSVLWSRLSKSNMDIQILVNGAGRNATCYTLKYTFKSQKIESTVIMKMGLLTKSVNRVISKEDNDEISPMERGKRIINSVLYEFTNPIEVPATIAALAIHRGSLFIMSHDPAYLNLAACAACYPDRNMRDKFGSNSHNQMNLEEQDMTMGEDDVGSQLDNVGRDVMDKRNALGEEDIDWADDDQSDHASIGSSEVEPTILVTIEKRDLYTNLDTKVNEIDQYLDFNKMKDYWYRPEELNGISYIDTIEQYHLELGEGPHYARMSIGHSNPTKSHWKVNKNFVRKCAVVVGKQIPNILAKTCSPEDREFYYKSLLILFKPHNSTDALLVPYLG